MRQKKSDALSGKADTEFLRCFAEKASQQNDFAGAVTAAQALIEMLPESAMSPSPKSRKISGGMDLP